MAGQANIHQDAWFARQFFKKGVWGQEFTGVDSTTVASGLCKAPCVTLVVCQRHIGERRMRSESTLRNICLDACCCSPGGNCTD